MIDYDFMRDDSYENDEDNTVSNSLIASMYTQMCVNYMPTGGIVVPFEKE